MRFYPPPAAIARYFTSFYCAEIAVAGGDRITDHLHPEWANLRFFAGSQPLAEARDGDRIGGTAFVATGPSSHAVRFSVGTCRLWGVGLLPLGWARFVDAPAAEYADRLRDGCADAAFAPFRELAANLFATGGDEEAELARLTTWFATASEHPPPDEERIVALHAALVDPETATVGDLIERTGASAKTIERLCHRAFGFAPKLLLRRQRFMRSLAQYMLDPSLTWIGALDGHYHDQAQFIRDFRRFMGMSPRQYAAQAHPVLDAFVRARLHAAGSPVQTLDPPQGLAQPAVAPARTAV